MLPRRATTVAWSTTCVSYRAPVPSLFRLTLISFTKQRKPRRGEIPAQRRNRRSRGRYQKFELNSCSALQPDGRPECTAPRTDLGQICRAWLT
jgi:hypothetical protein